MEIGDKEDDGADSSCELKWLVEVYIDHCTVHRLNMLGLEHRSSQRAKEL